MLVKVRILAFMGEGGGVEERNDVILQNFKFCLSRSVTMCHDVGVWIKERNIFMESTALKGTPW